MTRKDSALTPLFLWILTIISLTNSQSFSQSPVGSDSESLSATRVALNKAASHARPRPASLRVSVDLVLIPVIVTDALSHPETTLTSEHFSVYDGNELQQIRYFSVEDSPISVGLLLDVSSSMEDKIDTERAAVDQFFRNANPEDDYFVITFNNRPSVLSDVTRSTNSIETELGLIKPSGSTALLDAVYLGVSKLRNAKYSRRALVIISDGGDNASRYKLREIKSIIAESDVMVYAIGLFGTSPFKTFEEAMGRRWLSTMTDVTGGRTETISNLEELPKESAILSRELRSQYLLGYKPREVAPDGKWHKIKIVVKGSSEADPLRSYYRQGYFAPKP